MSKKTDRNAVIKQLKAIQNRANRGMHTHDDYKYLVRTLTKLTNLVYEPLINEERSREE